MWAQRTHVTRCTQVTHCTHCTQVTHCTHCTQVTHCMHCTQCTQVMHQLCRTARRSRTTLCVLSKRDALKSRMSRTHKTWQAMHPGNARMSRTARIAHTTRMSHSEEQLTMCIIMCAVIDNIYLSVSNVTFTVVDECTYQLTVP